MDAGTKLILRCAFLILKFCICILRVVGSGHNPSHSAGPSVSLERLSYLSRQVKRGHVSPVDAKGQAVVDFLD